MIRRPVKEISAEFAAAEESLPGIQRTVREACAAAGLERRDVTSVQLAIEEGITNIIRHAYLFEKGTIRLRIAVYKQLIVFSLIDTGRSFQPEGSGRLDLSRLVATGRKGGLGFYMIRKIMDSVEYIATSGANELRMIKRTPPAPTAERPLLRRLSTLRVKFSVWTFLIVSIIIGAAYSYLDVRTSRYLHAHLDGTVTALAKTIADQAAGYVINHRSDVEFDELTVSYLRANPELEQIVLTDSTGRILAHTADINRIRKFYRAPAGIKPSMVGVVQPLAHYGRSSKHLILPVEAGDLRLGLVHVTYTSEFIQDRIVEARWRIVLLTGVLLLFGVAGIYFLSNYFVRPIGKITQRVRRFASGDLETELPLEGAEEFFDISRAFNDMLTRLNHDRRNLVEKEKLAKEIEVASQIQKTLLPRVLPEVPGLEVEAFYRAAETVGGDLYDVFPIGDDRFCLTVADVSGKGVPASLVMSMLRTVIRIRAVGADSPLDILIRVNEYLQENIPPGMFITIGLIVYNCASRELRLASAGHNPMLLSRPGEEVTMINPSGMPLGVPATLGTSFEDALEDVSMVLNEGDGFVIFSDGVTEAKDRQGRQFGVDRLRQILTAGMPQDGRTGLTSLRDHLVGQLEEYSGFDRLTDDIAFIIARIPRITPTPEDRAGEGESDREVETRQVEHTGGT